MHKSDTKGLLSCCGKRVLKGHIECGKKDIFVTLFPGTLKPVVLIRRKGAVGIWVCIMFKAWRTKTPKRPSWRARSARGLV